MRSIMKNLFTSHIRNPTAEEDYIFEMQSIPGGVLKDSITGVPAVTSISGTRYGIVNGVVTQFAINQPPIEDTGLRSCPAFSQLTSESENSASAAWGGINRTVTAQGTLQGCAVHNVVENTAVAAQHTFNKNAFALAMPADNSIVGMSFKVKAAGRIRFSIQLQAKDGTYPTSANFNLATGSITVSTAVATFIAPIKDGYYSILVAFNALAGASAPLVYFQFMDDAGSVNYTGDGVSGFLISQVTYINFGVGGTPFIPPYVPNNTSSPVSVVAETATATTGTSFDLDNIKLAKLKTVLRGPNAQGHLELTFKSNIDSNWNKSGVNTYINIFSIGDHQYNRALYLFTDFDKNASFRISDGTSIVIATVPRIIPGQNFKIAVDFGLVAGVFKQRLTINGVKATLASFSGSFGTQDLRFFFGNTVHAGWIVKDSLKITDKPQW